MLGVGVRQRTKMSSRIWDRNRIYRRAAKDGSIALAHFRSSEICVYQCRGMLCVARIRFQGPVVEEESFHANVIHIYEGYRLVKIQIDDIALIGPRSLGIFGQLEANMSSSMLVNFEIIEDVIS